MNFLKGQLIHLYDVDGIQEMFRQDNVSVPKKYMVKPWTHWRKENNKICGIANTYVFL